MKLIALTAVLSAATLLQGCYGWEYAKLREIEHVENTPAVAKLSMQDFGASGDKYLRSVVEVRGTVLHIVNKGGQPAVVLGGPTDDLGLSLYFGPNQRKAVGKLTVSQAASFKGMVIKAPSFGSPGEIKPAIVLE